MDELKELLELILKLPAMGLWILAGYLLYKLVVIGSIYGVIKLAINSLFGWLRAPVLREYSFGGHLITEKEVNALGVVFSKLTRGQTYSVITTSDLSRLNRYVDEGIERDEAARRPLKPGEVRHGQ